jgi:hypothetical protein
MIRPASPPTASRCGRPAIADSGLRGSSWLCLYHVLRADPPSPSPQPRPCALRHVSYCGRGRASGIQRTSGPNCERAQFGDLPHSENRRWRGRRREAHEPRTGVNGRGTSARATEQSSGGSSEYRSGRTSRVRPRVVCTGGGIVGAITRQPRAISRSGRALFVR